MPKRKAPEAATFGERLVALRKAAAMTQQELADERCPSAIRKRCCAPSMPLFPRQLEVGESP
jgi:hypothetical protein